MKRRILYGDIEHLAKDCPKARRQQDFSQSGAQSQGEPQGQPGSPPSSQSDTKKWSFTYYPGRTHGHAEL